MQIAKKYNKNNTNFQGYLDTQAVKSQRKIWNKVEKKFATYTRDTNGGLRVEFTPDRLLLIGQIGGNWIECFTEKGTQKLMAQKPDVIADTLAKLHRFIEENDCTNKLFRAQHELWDRMKKKFPALRTKVMKKFLDIHMDEGLQTIRHAEHKKRFSYFKKNEFLKDLLKTKCQPLPDEVFNMKRINLEWKIRFENDIY